MKTMFVVCTTTLLACSVGCAVGSGPENIPAPALVDAGAPDTAFPSLGQLDHSCDYQLNGQICNDMISYDHYDAPDLVLAQYKMSCTKPEITNNPDNCMLWSLRDSKGNSFGYPDYWAWCCLPPDNKGFQ